MVDKQGFKIRQGIKNAQKRVREEEIRIKIKNMSSDD